MVEPECSAQTTPEAPALDPIREPRHTLTQANCLERGCLLQQDHQESPWRILLRAERLVRSSTEEIGFQCVNAFVVRREKGWTFRSRLRPHDSAGAAQRAMACRRRVRRLFHRT